MDSPNYKVHQIRLAELWADPEFNCRGRIAPIDVIELAKDIKARGLDQPIVVRPWTDAERPNIKYKVVAGHRREKAFRVNDSESIPAYIRPDLTEVEARTLNIRENLHRVDLNMKQEAHALKFFLNYKTPTGRNAFTVEELAALFGKSRGWVQMRQDLLKLPDDIQDEVAAGMITQEQVKILARVGDKLKLYEVVKKMKTMKLKGEKVKLSDSIQKASDVLKPKERDRGDVLQMNGMLYDIIGPGLITRYGAWVAGEISTAAFMHSVEEYCKNNNIKFTMPDFINHALLGITAPGVPQAVIA